MIVTTRGWTGAAIVYTHASGADTYTVASNTLNAYDVAVALRAWLDDAARPWAAAITSVTLTIEEDAAARRLRFVYAFAGGTPTFVSTVPNATWIARFGTTGTVPPSGCEATTSGVVASQRWERTSDAPSLRSRNGSLRMEAPRDSCRMPSVTFVGTRGQAYALAQAVRLASQPRQAYVLDEMTATWMLVTLGEVGPMEHPEDDALLVTGPIQAYGGL